MQPDDAVAMMIRNHRCLWWHALALRLLWSIALLGICVVALISKRVLPMEFALVVIFASIIGAGGLWLCTSPFVTALKLTDTLQPRPTGFEYNPIDIARIDFAPDPAEDYDDSKLPVRLC